MSFIWTGVQAPVSYCANGNALSSPSATPLAYDAENRVTGIGWNSMAEPAAYYAYDGQNKRSWSWGEVTDSQNNMTEYTVTAYSPSGQKLATYQCIPGTYYSGGNYQPNIAVSLVSSDQYFGGRRLAAMDQLGSAGTYYPWGEAKGNTNPQDTWSYATYWRDSATGLDYANNRYYSNVYGRFMTPDPYKAGNGSGDASNPQSWNRYAYVLGDPVNWFDPQGLDNCSPGDPLPCTITVTGYGGTGGAGSNNNDGGSQTSAPWWQFGGKVPYLNYIRSQDQQATNSILGQDLTLALNALKLPSCQKDFGTTQSRAGAWNPATVLATVFSASGGYIGGSSVNSGFSVSPFYPIGGDATTGPAIFFGQNTGGVAAGFSVAINSAAWNATGDVAGTGPIFQAAGLLHELGHIFAFTSAFGSGGSAITYDGLPGQGSVSNANTDKILLDCFGIKD